MTCVLTLCVRVTGEDSKLHGVQKLLLVSKSQDDAGSPTVARVAYPMPAGWGLAHPLPQQAVEGDHSMCPPPPIRNEQPVLVLMRWLPTLPTAELRLFLAQRLWWLCDSCPASRATCVQAGLVGCLLETLSEGVALGARCQEQLLALLQALGHVSLRPSELRRLLRPPPGLDLGPGRAEAG